MISKSSHRKCSFECPDCKHPFESTLNNITNNGNWCPFCKNKTEKILFSHLNQKYPTIIHQFKPDWSINPKTNYHLSFDFCIELLKLIIELDGPQHFIQISNWQSPEETQDRDVEKIKLALDNGYSVVHLLQEDVFYNKNSWQLFLDQCLVQRTKPVLLCSDKEKYVHLENI